MIKVIILGAGNVGSHLINAFLNHPEIDLIQLYNRDLERINHLKNQVPITDSTSDLLVANVYIISISDDAISLFSDNLDLSNKLIVHTSGSLGLDVLTSNRKGVFYPLQTFSKSKDIDFKSIPICIESNNDKDLVLLETLASSISDHVYILDSDKRKKMHLSAVFVNNFVNHLYQIGSQICEENGVPFEILHPLIFETAKKIGTLTPFDAQTGPAKRNDISTIAHQMAQLKENELHIYKILTESIQKNYSEYGKKL